MEAKRVLVFGSSGVGKTSLLNIITGQNNRTSSSALGCTFEATNYEIVKIRDIEYQFIDTAGLNEGSSGTVPSKTALTNLINLVLQNKAGFNLLIMVIKCGRIDAATERQYKLFANHLGCNVVPMILVVTCCEGENSLSAWSENTENQYALARYGMKFRAVVGTSCAKSRNAQIELAYSTLRQNSKESVIKEIERHSLSFPIRLVRSGVLELVRQIYNYIASAFHWPLWTSTLSKLLVSMGVEVDEALETERKLLREGTFSSKS